MPAYVIANITFSDAPEMQLYRERVPAIIANHGGKYLVRGGPIEVLEGGPMDDRRIVVLEFPDKAAAHRFYDSPEYQEFIGLRQDNSEGNLVLVEGYTG